MQDRIEMLPRFEADDAAPRVRLLAPAPGLFTQALDRGAALAAGQEAGRLLSLSRAHLLVVPAGVAGQVVTRRPERVHQPVSFGDVLYELAPFAAAPPAGDSGSELLLGEELGSQPSTGALHFRSPQAGRFYQRPAPADPPFLRAGDVLEPGRPLGLIEVMKTFTHVSWQPSGALPQRARFLRYLVGDASDVAQGQGLCEVEPA